MAQDWVCGADFLIHNPTFCHFRCSVFPSDLRLETTRKWEKLDMCNAPWSSTCQGTKECGAACHDHLQVAGTRHNHLAATARGGFNGPLSPSARLGWSWNHPNPVKRDMVFQASLRGKWIPLAGHSGVASRSVFEGIFSCGDAVLRMAQIPSVQLENQNVSMFSTGLVQVCCACTQTCTNNCWLVVWTPLKNICQLGYYSQYMGT